MSSIISSKAVERVSCPLCGDDDTEIFIRGSGLMHIVRCCRDGMLYVNPRPLDTRIKESSESFVRDVHDHVLLSRTPALIREANGIKVQKNGGNILDVGCATGLLFENFSGPGWRCFGVDPCAAAAEEARRRYGAEVWCGTLEEGIWPWGFFDVVAILDALYYFANPLHELTAANHVLKQDGILALEIPGFIYKLFRERGPICWLLDHRWSRIKPESMHLYHFSGRTLRLLLEKAGFRIIKRIPVPAPLGRSFQVDLVNRIHFRFAQALSFLTFGRLSLAAKEFYLCRKAR